MTSVFSRFGTFSKSCLEFTGSWRDSRERIELLVIGFLRYCLLFFCGQKGFFVLFFFFVFSHDLFHLGFWIPGDLDPDLGFSLAWLVSVIRFCRLGFFIQT
jgi:hypothetical protein